MPEGTHEVADDLKLKFAGIENSQYFNDYAEIGSFLSDPGKYLSALTQLHRDMEVEFDRRIDIFGPSLPKFGKLNKRIFAGAYKNLRDPEKSSVFQPDHFAMQAFKKLLTNALTANEINVGFRVGSNNYLPDILLGNPGAQFNQLLRDKKVFKDLNAGKEHGENSHRIQWYLISKMTTLGHPVTDIYQSLPDWRTKGTKPRAFYLWEYLVDRDGVPTNAALIPFKTQHQSDFRGPSNVNRYLIGGHYKEFYLLEACLANRWEKRVGVCMDEYLAKKMGKDFKKMSQEEQTLFTNAIFNEMTILRR